MDSPDSYLETESLKEQWANENCLGGLTIWSIDFYSPSDPPKDSPIQPAPIMPLRISNDGSCGNGVSCVGSTFGDCCSAHGYCGSTDAYCTATNGCQADFGTCGASSATHQPIVVSMPVSKDGSCGNGITCQDSVFGNCCSTNGFCGTTVAYCSAESGCQTGFGACAAPIASIAPPAPVSMDGKCGNGVTCLKSSFGNCCSTNSYCGSTDDYCAITKGCQDAFGTCQ